MHGGCQRASRPRPAPDAAPLVAERACQQIAAMVPRAQHEVQSMAADAASLATSVRRAGEDSAKVAAEAAGATSGLAEVVSLSRKLEAALEVSDGAGCGDTALCALLAQVPTLLFSARADHRARSVVGPAARSCSECVCIRGPLHFRVTPRPHRHHALRGGRRARGPGGPRELRDPLWMQSP